MRTNAQRDHLASLAAEVMRLGLRQEIATADFVALGEAIRALLDARPATGEARDAA